MTITSVFAIIIYKPRHWQEFSLVILLKVDKNLKIGLYGAVLPLFLAISLRLKYGK